MFVAQDMPHLYFALLNKAMAVEECDATMSNTVIQPGIKQS
jgi:hypothetical protein